MRIRVKSVNTNLTDNAPLKAKSVETKFHGHSLFKKPLCSVLKIIFFARHVVKQISVFLTHQNNNPDKNIFSYETLYLFMLNRNYKF